MPQTQAERAGAAALAAMQRGQAALARGDTGDAVQWLERACRYAPEDPSPLLSLATARLAAGAAAAALDGFRAVARRSDVREAWLGQVVAALRLGRAADAAAALAHALSRHRWTGSDGLADAVVASAGLPGWCALAADGTVAVGRRPGGRLVVMADGRPLARGAPVPDGVRRIDVTLDSTPLLGSPIDAAAIGRVEGVVQAEQGGIAGWAWHPADAERDPVLTLGDGTRRLTITAADQTIASPRPLTRPRRFAVAAGDLAGFSGLLRVSGADGRELAGSPVDPGAAARSAAAVARQVARRWPLRGEPASSPDWPTQAAVPAAIQGPPATAPLCPERPVAVVVPVYRGLAETLACLAAVRRTLPQGCTVLVVDDASPEPALVAALDALAGTGAVRLLRLAENRGFPGAANAGLRAAAELPGGHDLLLLNSDTVPGAAWLEALRLAVHSAADIGSASPLSNDATILTYPDPAAPAAPPTGPALERLARQAGRANAGGVVELPTSVGFCMYVRRECLEQTGVLREDVFAQGYGEENDFCLRARHLGWRHVGVPGAYVAHQGGRSFGAARAALVARNLDVLESIHPGYRALIDDWVRRDPLLPARRRIDALRWAASCRRAGGVGGGSAVLLVTHESGGGVERCVRARAEALRAEGLRPVLLRPVLDRSGDAAALERDYLPGLCRIDEPGTAAPEWANLRFRLPDEIADLAALLRLARPVGMEVHHLLGHDHAVLDLARCLGVPYEVRLHDYAWFCPRISLLGASGRYCGEPDVAGCVACVADLGSRLEEPIGVAALLARSAADLAGAARVIAPSADAAQRLARHFPGISPQVEPHEPDLYAKLTPPRRGRTRRVCVVVGAIGPEKGYDVLLACARDAAARDLALEFRLVGHSIDDARLIETGRVHVTGPFAAADADALIRAQRGDLGFIPSVWPETWCLALGEAWRAGLAVAAFDLGAPAERIRATGRGWLLPLGLPAARVNNALLTFRPLASRDNVMQTEPVEMQPRHAPAPP